MAVLAVVGAVNVIVRFARNHSVVMACNAIFSDWEYAFGVINRPTCRDKALAWVNLRVMA